jgi:S-DNA-T family DNA segregation ATPase FtsK/SpoIIIE
MHLESILEEFDCPGVVRQVRTGPVVQTMLVELGAGVRVRKVAALEDDIALRLGVDSVRVVPNVPGLPYLGVEVPRDDRQLVRWVPSNGSATLPLALGVDTLGVRVTVDLAKAPHLLVAGATGSGKSICVHTMICSLIAAPVDVRFLLIDPKMLEFRAYEEHPMLAHPVITDAMRATRALGSVVNEMERRYTELARVGCRDIGEYNARGGRMTYVVVVIDEWADLHSMQGKGIELPVVRLAQKARAAGIHMVLATQRPSVKVLSGLIKGNFPARIALKVTNMTDSRVILDRNGAERLLGRGDMLVSGFGLGEPTRVHGAFIEPEQELNKL